MRAPFSFPPLLHGPLAAALALCLGACGSVRPPASGLAATPKPAGCSIEFLREAPTRPHDDLGELYGYWPGDVRPEDVLRQKACTLGADAIVITRDFLASTGDSPDRKVISGTAIKYRSDP